MNAEVAKHKAERLGEIECGARPAFADQEVVLIV